jgi:hypothetical protein
MVAWEGLASPQTLSFLLAGGFMLALAAGLLWLNFASRPHRAFALFLALRAGNLVLNAFRTLPDMGAAEAGYLLRVLPYLLLPVPLVLLYFSAVYPKPRGWLARSPLAAPALLAAVALVELLYLADHTLLWALAFDPGAAGGFTYQGNGWVAPASGPLAVLVGSIFPSYALVALLFAHDYVRSASQPLPHSWRLVSLGFAVNALFDGTLQLLNALALAQSGQPYAWLPWGWTLALLPCITLLPAALAMALLVGHARRTPGHAGRLRLLGLAALLPPLSALVLATLGAGAAFLTSPLARFVLGIWRLALPALVALALVRYNLFDIDLKVKFAMKQGTVAATFVAVFFVASETAQQVFSGVGGSYFGIAAAGVLVLGMHPLQRLAERLADKAMPGVKPMQEMSRAEKSRFYREQAALAWEDGALNKKERLMLNSLRERLGLSHEDASRLELEVARA